MRTSILILVFLIPVFAAPSAVSDSQDFKLLVGGFVTMGGGCRSFSGAVENCNCFPGNYEVLVDYFIYQGQHWKMYFCFVNNAMPTPYGQGMLISITNSTNKGYYPLYNIVETGVGIGCVGCGLSSYPVSEPQLGAQFIATPYFGVLDVWKAPYPYTFYYLVGGWSVYTGSYQGITDWGKAKNNTCPKYTRTVNFSYNRDPYITLGYCVVEVDPVSFF